MDPIILTTHLQSINYIQIFEILLKWAVPIFILFIGKDILSSIAAYFLLRADKYISIGTWVTYRDFKGRIVKLGPFSVILRDISGDECKIPIKSFKNWHVIFHPICNDPDNYNKGITISKSKTEINRDY